MAIPPCTPARHLPRPRINTDNFNEIRDFCKMTQGSLHPGTFTGKNVGIKNVFPGLPANRTRLDFAQIEVAEGKNAQSLEQSSRHVRSEEHTSELQSPDHLVCRLLLEKKKNQ